MNMSTVLIAVLAALAVGLGVYVAFLLSGKRTTLDKARGGARGEAGKGARAPRTSRYPTRPLPGAGRRRAFASP